MTPVTAAMDRTAGEKRRRKRAGQQAVPERRCIATGESGPTDRLIRFALSPEGEAVPDLAARLPGRGVWLSADRALVEKAVKKRLFSRVFRAQVTIAEDLPELLERLLVERMIAIIGFARKAGQAVTGAEKVRARIRSGMAGLLIQARDGSPEGRRKMTALAHGVSNGRIEPCELLDAAELGLAFGRDFAIYTALDSGGFARRLLTEAQRLSGFRDALPDAAAARDETGRITPGRARPKEMAEPGAMAVQAPKQDVGAELDNDHSNDNDHVNDEEGPDGPARQDDL